MTATLKPPAMRIDDGFVDLHIESWMVTHGPPRVGEHVTFGDGRIIKLAQQLDADLPDGCERWGYTVVGVEKQFQGYADGPFAQNDFARNDFAKTSKRVRRADDPGPVRTRG